MYLSLNGKNGNDRNRDLCAQLYPVSAQSCLVWIKPWAKKSKCKYPTSPCRLSSPKDLYSKWPSRFLVWKTNPKTIHWFKTCYYFEAVKWFLTRVVFIQHKSIWISWNYYTTGTNICRHLTITLISGPSKNRCHKIRNTQLQTIVFE